MPSIFVSFRKVDNRWMRDRVYQALSAAFGAGEVFKSGESIPAGSDFSAVLRRQAADCKIMLVLIGTDWVDARDAEGGRLLDRRDDWVRIEIATALGAGNRVVPVLLGDASMLPAPAALPEDIAELAQLQFLRVPETHLEDGLRRLTGAVSEMLPQLARRDADAAAVPGALAVAPGPVASAPAVSVPAVHQSTGGGNAVTTGGSVHKSKVAGGDIRETKINTGGLFATLVAFLTSRAGIVTTTVVAVGATGATVAATHGGGGAGGVPQSPINTQLLFGQGVHLSPDAGPAGTTVTVSGSGFPAGQQLVVNVGIPGGDGLARLTTDSAGNVSGRFTIPADAEHRVVSVYILDGMLPVATSSFQITG